MKVLKIFALVLGAVAVLLAIGLALALTPSVQTWAVRRALAGQPGMKPEIGRVAAGFSDADVSDLRIEKDGAIIVAKGVTAKYSAWDYITSKRINVDQVTVTDLLVDLRNAKPAAAPADGTAKPGGATPTTDPGAADPARKGKATTGRPDGNAKSTPFPGVLSQAQLPFDVRVARLDVKGRALLPDEQSADFTLKGTDITTGQRGQLEFQVDFADARKASPLPALHSNGVAGVHITKDGRIDVVELDVTASAEGPNLPKDRFKLVAKAEQPAAKGDENFVVSLGLDRAGRVERILGSTARFNAAQHDFSGSWELALRSEQLAALLAGFGLPELAANGAGKFAFKPDTSAASASGELQGTVTALEKISPELRTIGAMQFKASFDGGLAGPAARLEKFQLEANTRDGKKLAQIHTTQRVGFDLETKRVSLADPKAELARVAIQSLPLAWAQPFVKAITIDSGDLSLTLAVEAEPDGSRVRARSVEPLALRSVTVRSGDKKLAEQVTLTVRPQLDYSSTRVVAQLADLNVTMPAGDSLTGQLGAEVTNLATKPAIAFTSQLEAKIVAALKPYLPLDPGPLAVQMAAEGRLNGDVLQLAKASATVNRQNGGLLGAFELQQPVTANLGAGTATVPKPAATAARVRLGEVPLAWAEAFVEKSKFAGAVTGATLELSFRSAEDVTLTTTEPFTLRGVSATLDGKPMVQGLDVAAELTATKRGEKVDYELRRLDVKQGDAALAALKSSGQATLGKKVTLVAKGNLEADVAALMKQPAAAAFATLSRGQLTTAFDANVGDTIQAKAAVSAKNLVARQDNQALGDLQLTLDANMKPDGSGTFSLPLTLTNAARKSDVTVNGTFGKRANSDTYLFTGRIASNNFVVDDFQPLAALAPAGDQSKTPAPPSTQPRPTPPVASTPDADPFWKGVNGKVELDLKRILYGKDYVISGVRGTTMISDTRLSLDGLEGRFKENPFKLAGGVTFSRQNPKPYTLAATADVTNFDVGAFLRAANPNEKPALDAKFTLSAKLNGNGGTVGDLAKNAFGRFDLSGGQGVLRALARKGQGGELVNLGSTILGAIGAARGSDTTMAVAEVARFLAEVPFDNIKMQVERAADLSFKLTSLELLSPVVHLTGSGGVQNRGTGDIQNQPMQVLLQLGARGEIAHLMNRVNMLGQKQDEKGYQLLTRTFTIGGTPANPDSSSLWKTILAEAAKLGAAKGLPALQDLLGRE